MARDLQRRAAARLCRGAGRPSAASPASRSSAQARVASSPCRQRRGRPADRSRADNRGLAVVRAHRRLRVVHAPGPPQRGRPWQAAVHQAGITDLRARGWRRGSAMEAATLLRCGSWERACQWWCGPGSSTAGVALGAGPIPASKRLPIPRGSARIDANARIGHLVAMCGRGWSSRASTSKVADAGLAGPKLVASGIGAVGQPGFVQCQVWSILARDCPRYGESWRYMPP